MDRRVKERLVGASILVLLIILIVPELLSGPAPAPAAPPSPMSPPDPVRSITLDLKTSKAQSMAAPTLDTVAAPGAATPGPASPGSAAASAAQSSTGETGMGVAANPPSQAPAAAPVEIVPQHPTSVVTPGKPANSGHAWAVQLGSFASHDNADKLARQLKAKGFTVYVSPGGSGSSLRYRVRVGPMADRETATQTAAKLRTLGQVASLVPAAS